MFSAFFNLKGEISYSQDIKVDNSNKNIVVVVVYKKLNSSKYYYLKIHQVQDKSELILSNDRIQKLLNIYCC